MCFFKSSELIEEYFEHIVFRYYNYLLLEPLVSLSEGYLSFFALILILGSPGLSMSWCDTPIVSLGLVTS